MATGIRCPSCGDVQHLAPPILLTICSCGKSFATPVMTARLLIHHKGLISTRCLASTGQHQQTISERHIDNARRETHPDAGGAPGEFQAVQAAWEVLGDEERRRRYDRSARPIGREPSHEACLTFLMSPSLLLCDASSQQVSPPSDARTSPTRPACGHRRWAEPCTGWPTCRWGDGRCCDRRLRCWGHLDGRQT